MGSALHKQDFLVLSNQADIHNRVSTYSIANYMQEAARSHAENLGWGLELLHTQKKFWVLTRLHLQIDVYPRPGQTIQVQTWPKGTDRFFALRDFKLYLNNDEIGRATSSWAMLQLPNRKPTTITGFDDLVKQRQHIHGISDLPSKLPHLGEEADTFLHHVTYSELDLNGHVNYSRYINWMLDTLPFEFHQKHTVKELKCNYLAEVFPDQKLQIARKESSKNTFEYEVRNPDKKPLFRGLLHFK